MPVGREFLLGAQPVFLRRAALATARFPVRIRQPGYLFLRRCSRRRLRGGRLGRGGRGTLDALAGYRFTTSGGRSGHNYFFLGNSLVWHIGIVLSRAELITLFYPIAGNRCIESFYQLHYGTGSRGSHCVSGHSILG